MNTRAIESDLQAALRAVEEKHGVKIGVARAKWLISSGSVVLSVEAQEDRNADPRS